MMELREETHLLPARFGDVYGINRATVAKVEKIEKWPLYTPSEDVIRRWLDATTKEPLHEFMGRFAADELAQKTPTPEQLVTNPVSPSVHTLPFQQTLGESHAVVGSSAHVSAEDFAALLEQFATQLFTAAAAFRGVRPLRSDDPPQPTTRRTGDPVGGPDPARARRIK